MYDGAVKIDTSLDMKGLDEAMRKFKSAIEGGADKAKVSLDAVNNAVSETTAGANKLSPAFKLDDDDIKDMEKSLDNVNAKIEVQQRQLYRLQNEYKRVVRDMGENSDKALSLQKRMLNLDSSISGMIKKSDKLAVSIEDGLTSMAAAAAEATSATEQAATASSEMAETIDGGAKKSSSSIRGMGKVLDNVLKIFGVNVGENVERATSAFSDMGKNIGEVSDGAGASLDGVGVSGALIGTAVAGGAIKAIEKLKEISDAAQTLADDIEFSSDRIEVALGLTGEEAKNAQDSIKNIYHEGLVSNREDAEAALTAVMRLMGAQGKEAEDLANKVIGIKTAFGEDFTSTARTAATMMQTFGIDGKAALDIITAGLQTSANKNGDLLDVLNEYAPAFERAGFTGEEMLSKIVSATDAGAYSADKAADAFKEFYNKAASDSDAFKAALDALGLNGETSMRKLTSGGQTAQAEFEKIVTKLGGVKTETERARIASELFGSQWEDVGMSAVLAMSGVNTSIIHTENAANNAYQTIRSNNKTTTQALQNEWGETAKNIGGFIVDSLLGPVSTLIDLLKEDTWAEFLGTLDAIFKGDWKSVFKGEWDKKLQSMGGYATGTASAAPGLRWVGESGPELVNFRGGEAVYTAAQSMSAATNQLARASVEAPTIINNYFNQRVDDLDTFVAIRDKVVHEQQYTRQGYVGR